MIVALRLSLAVSGWQELHSPQTTTQSTLQVLVSGFGHGEPPFDGDFVTIAERLCVPVVESQVENALHVYSQGILGWQHSAPLLAHVAQGVLLGFATKLLPQVT